MDKGLIILIFIVLAGKVYTYSDISTQSGTGFIKITGNTNNDLGTTVLNKIDLNGDHIDDMVVAGAYHMSIGGIVYVIYGGTLNSNIDLTTSLPASKGFKITAVAANDKLGVTLANAGDMNGDGIDDLAITALEADPSSRTDAGSVYVIFGKATPISDINLASGLSSSVGFKIDGAMAYDGLGSGLAGCDVNGDGFSDLIVGAFTATRLGRTKSGVVYIIYGKSGISNIDLSSTTAQITKIIGSQAIDHLGSTAFCSDVTGDKNPDLILAGTYATRNGKSIVGFVDVIYGKKAVFPDMDLATDWSASLGFTIIGPSQSATFGRSLSSGDVNGDGIKDIVVIASGASPLGRTYAGAAYVIFGKSTSTDIDLGNTLSPTQGYMISGPIANKNMGYSVSASGDVNGDRIDDIIIGMELADVGSISKAGTAYVIFGRSTGNGNIDLASTFSGYKILGFNTANSNLGFAVTMGGDNNGDDHSDILVGAPFYTGYGAAFLLKGACDTGYNKFYNKTCYITCPDGTYSTSGTQCAECGTGCKACTSPTVCTTCFSALGYVKLYNGQCYTSCPSGTYSTSGTGCAACGTGCLSCTNSTICKTCDVSGGYLKLFNGLCYSSCPSGSYSDSSTTCAACETGCLSCLGSGPKCQTCNSTGGYPKLYNGVCYATCPAKTFSSSASECTACLTGCLSCSSAGPACTSCDTASGFMKLYNSVCYLGCPSGSYSSSATGCAACDAGCLTCSANGGTCTLCDKSAGYKILYNGVCYTSCPRGSYSVSDTECHACSDGCSECISGTNCTVCDSDSGFIKHYNGFCYQTCPNATFSDSDFGCAPCSEGCSLCTDVTNCQSCFTNHVYNGSCTACEPRTYASPGTSSYCSACPKGCANCTSDSECGSCDAGYELKNSLCVESTTLLLRISAEPPTFPWFAVLIGGPLGLVVLSAIIIETNIHTWILKCINGNKAQSLKANMKTREEPSPSMMEFPTAPENVLKQPPETQDGLANQLQMRDRLRVASKV